MKFLVVLMSFCIGFAAHADRSLIHGFTPEESNWMANQNAMESQRGEIGLRSLGRDLAQKRKGSFRPFAEYKEQGYLIFNDELHFNAAEAKRGFLKNLPDHVTPVIYTQTESPEYIQNLRENFGAYLSSSNELKIVYVNSKENSFWARDGVPVPGYHKKNGEESFMVIDAKYYYDFEPDQQFAEQFNALMWSHNYYFEGGNFIPNDKGDCLVVNNERVTEIPDSIFEVEYGCKNLVRLPHIRGIGHADESVKFLDDDLVITDLKEYERILKRKGFNVVLFPRAEGEYETYINSVIVGDTVYMPSYGNKLDEDAMNAYRLFGYNPVLLNSYTLSNTGLGSLHCISMVYPPNLKFTDLLAD